MTLTIWWRKHITNVYRQHVAERNTQILEGSVSLVTKERDEARATSEKLGKVVHRDNKIVPAMYKTVEAIAETNNSPQVEVLLETLRKMCEERKELVTDCRHTGSQPKTGDVLLDGMLQFLQNRAETLGAKMEFSVIGEIQTLDKRIERTDFNTLFCDLGENALLAVQGTDNAAGGNVYLAMDFNEPLPRLRFYDDGPAFDGSVIAGLGKKKTTTRRETGGSGIGLFTLFEILRKYEASFYLDEQPESDNFTKCVEILFDGAGEYKIRTEREEIKEICKARGDIICV